MLNDPEKEEEFHVRRKRLEGIPGDDLAMESRHILLMQHCKPQTKSALPMSLQCWVRSSFYTDEYLPMKISQVPVVLQDRTIPSYLIIARLGTRKLGFLLIRAKYGPSQSEGTGAGWLFRVTYFRRQLGKAILLLENRELISEFQSQSSLVKEFQIEEVWSQEVVSLGLLFIDVDMPMDLKLEARIRSKSSLCGFLTQ